MMRRLTILFILISHLTFSQEVCTSSRDGVEDLNSISDIKKCTVTVEKSKNAKNPLKITVISNRGHHKRKLFANEEVKAVSELHSGDVTAVEAVNSPDVTMRDLKEKIIELNKRIEKENNTFSFDTVDVIPMFHSCADGGLDDVDCFNYEMQKHLMDNIEYPAKAIKKKIEGDIWVSFVITSNGSIKDIMAEGPENTDVLKEEAVRIVSLLPVFEPGKQDSKSINVTYKFPISFNLQNLE
ncbi:energy transducer TonB [Tenacibaculum sp. 190524A02b]|uniref:Periplasmic protein TonB n=1 Tax=Tenacibaculum vairaonense TaxID=3137860 RepID=A0ABP1FCS3_9FLAO